MRTDRNFELAALDIFNKSSQRLSIARTIHQGSRVWCRSY